jgi:hypothetical protein
MPKSEREIISRELFKPRRLKFPRRKFRVFGIEDVVCFDLLELRDLKRFNDNHQYILLGINAFSKLGFLRALKNKKADHVTEKVEEILDAFGHPFRFSASDKGGEFTSGAFKRLMKERNISIYYSHSEKKNPIAERFVRSIKNILFKKLFMSDTKRWIDQLGDIESQYNQSFHRTIMTEPVKVNKNNEKAIFERAFDFKSVVTRPRFKLGDRVRVSFGDELFLKERHGRWSVPIFRIRKVNNKNPHHYLLETDDQKIKVDGGFYSPELQLTREEEKEIEKILQRKGPNVLVKWKNYPENFATLENKKDMEEKYNIKI